MSPAGPFPLYYPGDARRAFGSDEATRRFARVAQLEPGSRVLVLGCGPNTAAVLLARDLGCSVVAADTEEANLTAACASGCGRWGWAIAWRRAAWIWIGSRFPEGEFDADPDPGPRVLPAGRIADSRSAGCWRRAGALG